MPKKPTGCMHCITFLDIQISRTFEDITDDIQGLENVRKIQGFSSSCGNAVKCAANNVDRSNRNPEAQTQLLRFVEDFTEYMAHKQCYRCGLFLDVAWSLSVGYSRQP